MQVQLWELWRLWQAGLMSLAIIAAEIMGDLVISSVKKSLGASYPEGDDIYITRGILERMAPLTFAAPVFYHLTVIFFMN